MNEKHDSSQKNVFGWANTNSSHSTVVFPKTTEDVCRIAKKAKSEGQKIIGRGAGQSYGDEFLNENGLIIDTSRLNRIIKWDPKSGLIRVQAGVKYEELLAYCLKDGWVPAVVPGTRYVSMGGALANNVHGKNSYARGNFGEWVQEFEIVLPSSEKFICSRKKNEDLFFSAIGGAGLLGIITEITLQLIHIPSPYLLVKRSTASSLNKLIDGLDEVAKKSDYVIAQVDCFPESAGIGRGTIHAANFASNNFDIKDMEKIQKIPPRMFGIFPIKWIPIIGKYFLNNYIMRWVSRLKYYLDKKASGEKLYKQDFFQFTFFLDKVPDWKRVFHHGFLEYEPLIPKGKARTVIPQLIALTHKYKMPAYLSAIKIHRKDNFILSYSMDGYSFAMDIPRQPKKKEKQDELFRKMNEIVIDAGGIVYLAKDAVLTRDEFRQMYDVERFLEVKKKYDPDEIFQSDMYRRIFKKQS